MTLGNDWGRAVTIEPLAWMSANRGNYSYALSLLEEGLQLAHEEGSLYAKAHTLRAQATLRHMYGDYIGAIPFMREVLEVQRELGDRRAEAGNLHVLGFCLMTTGELDELVASAKRALPFTGSWEAIARSIGRFGTSLPLVGSPVSLPGRSSCMSMP